MDANAQGRLEQLEDGRWRLRFTRTLEHPPEKVWRAITEPEHLAHWFRRRSTASAPPARSCASRSPAARLRPSTVRWSPSSRQR